MRTGRSFTSSRKRRIEIARNAWPTSTANASRVGERSPREEIARKEAAPRTRAPVGGQAKVKERIDVALVSRGLAPTREKAARLLLAGAVLVDGRRVDKPGVLVAPGAELKVTARQK